MLEPVVLDWSRLGYGIDLGEGRRITHALWCDNIWLFSQCRAQLRNMIAQLSSAVYACRFCSKPSSLECISAGTDDYTHLIVDIPGGNLKYTTVTQMLVLGVLMDKQGKTMTSIDHRLDIGESIYLKHFRVLTRPGNLQHRLQAWSAAPGSSALHGCGTWHLTRQVLHKLRRWEYKLLRRMFKFKFQAEDGPAAFNLRTALKLQAWFQLTGTWHLHHRALSLIHKAAWRVVSLHVGGQSLPLHWAREHRDEIWWQTVLVFGRHQRIGANLQQRASGHITQWEDVCVATLGLHWKEDRARCDSFEDWDSGKITFINDVCKAWGLPVLPASTVKRPLPMQCPDNPTMELKRFEDTPLCKLRQDDKCWPGPPQQFQCVVDCQVLANLLNGTCLLVNPELRPVFVRMARTLAALFDSGWTPKAAADAVQRRERDWNRGADHLCNVSMDHRRKILEVDVDLLAIRMRSGCNLQIHSDGGLRRGYGAAMGWTITAWSRESKDSWRRDVVAKCCVFLEVCTSSFTAETLALEAAIDMLSSLVFKSRGL